MVPALHYRSHEGQSGARRPPEPDRRAETGDASAKLALAWLLSKKPWIVPIPGTTKLHRLEENIGAASVALTANDMGEIEEAAAKVVVEGARGTGREKHA